MNKIICEDMQDIIQRGMDLSKFKNQTVLISGATGMLASYLAYFFIYLNETYLMNIRILLLVRSQEKASKKFGYYLQKKYLKVYKFDINKEWDISEPIDYIIHAASLASPQFYTAMPVQVAAPNAIGTYYMLCLARDKQVKKVLYFSSGDIYGKMLAGKNRLNENMMGIMNPLDEHSCYGESKRMGETWCVAFAREYQVSVVIARIFHTYGPTMDIENDPRVFASFMKCICDKEDIIMYSDGKAKRTFCYIADATAAFLQLLLNGESGEAYNICNSDAFVSVFELANLLVQLRPSLNLKVVRKTRPANESYLENKANHDTLPTEEKLKALNWECHFNIEKGFNRVLQYFEMCRK